HPTRSGTASLQVGAADAPAGGGAGGVLGLDDDLRQVDLVVDLALERPDPVLEEQDPLLEQRDAGLGLVGAAGARHLGVAELALERREEVERVAAPVGTRDLAFLLGEEDRELG